MSTLGILLPIALLLPLANPAENGDGQAMPRTRNLRSLSFGRTLRRLEKRGCDPTDGCQTTVCETDTGPCCCKPNFTCQISNSGTKSCSCSGQPSDCPV
uniref:Conotoxin Di19A n=1 Tax=Conus distans TaxID=72281 RepID=CJA_CONDI|nr:RecName: Full=Conotoxin Di19A; AltName: Full=Conotoxin di16a; Flags: Precursor [Conus distans]ADN79122.1 putative M superfamily conotoxin [Conus distans]